MSLSDSGTIASWSAGVAIDGFAEAERRTGPRSYRAGTNDECPRTLDHMTKHAGFGLAVGGFALGATLLIIGCGDERSEPGDPDGTGGSAAPAIPFMVESVPDGYELVWAGAGERAQEWGNDSAGTDEPLLVVADGDQRVVVNTFGYEGYQGGFGQGAYKGREEDGWVTEARDLGDDLGIKATSADVDREVLADLLDRVVAADDRMDAPTISDLPDGWSVVGHSDADVVLAIGSPGGAADSFGASWSVPDQGDAGQEASLTVASVPGDAADLAAWRGRLPRPVLWYGDAVGVPSNVNGRDAVFVAVSEGEGGTMHVLLSSMEGGSLLVVTSAGSPFGPGPLPEETLVQVAASVRPADSDEWTAFTDSAWGGPELHADEGAVELARGTEQGQEWLLQATRSAPRTTNVAPDPDVEWFIDPCLKLLGGRRACADGDAGPGVSEFRAGTPASGSSGFPSSFRLVVTRLPGARAEITTRNDTATIALHPLPDGSSRVGVFFADLFAGLSVPGCSRVPLPGFDDASDVEIFTVDILDASGAFLGCTPSIITPPDSQELRIG